MRKSTIAFTERMTQDGYKYEVVDGGDGRDIVTSNWSVDNMQSIRVTMFLDDYDVAAKVFSIAKVPADKKRIVLEKINELHNKWRWVTFYIDADSEITAQIDAVFSKADVGEVCSTILSKIINIADESYSEFMKVVW